MTLSADEAIVDDLQHRVLDILDGVRDVALLDVPHHTNSGDAAILRGEVAALEKLGCRIHYVGHYLTWNLQEFRRRVPADAVVLFHGGGNFGSLYPEHHLSRLAILDEIPDHRVIFLPQSVWFEDDRPDTDTVRRLAGHPDVTFYARDETSRTVMEPALPDRVRLAPDMAFGMGALTRPPRSGAPVVFLRRSDKETAFADPVDLPGVSVVDWPGTLPDVTTRQRLVANGIYASLSYGSRSPRLATLLADRLPALATVRVRRAVEWLGSAEVVITDRLHGHILCTLLGTPHVILDNRYGKIGNFATTWTSGSSLVRRAETERDAARIAHELLAEVRS